MASLSDESKNASVDSEQSSPAPSPTTEAPIVRIQPSRLKRRASYGPKAEPLAKKLWRKKERERLRELDEQIRMYTLQIAEKEALYRRACQQKQVQQCDDLTQQLSELLELKLAATRDKADLKMQITRKSRNANAKFRTL